LRNKQRIFEDERCQTVREKKEKKNKQTVNRSMDEKKREKVMKHDFLLDVRNERNILYKQKKNENSIFNQRYLYIMSIPSRKNNALTTTTNKKQNIQDI
jgi:hypothetical protein